MVVAMFGCTTEPDVPPPPPPPPPEPMEPTEIGVTRVFAEDTVSPGAETKIKLYVNLEPEQTYYLFEEGVPKEFQVLDGETDPNNKLKQIEIQNAKSTVVEYRVKAPSTPGTYTWTGEYAVEFMDGPADIMGDTTLTVQ